MVASSFGKYNLIKHQPEFVDKCGECVYKITTAKNGEISNWL